MEEVHFVLRKMDGLAAVANPGSASHQLSAEQHVSLAWTDIWYMQDIAMHISSKSPTQPNFHLLMGFSAPACLSSRLSHLLSVFPIKNLENKKKNDVFLNTAAAWNEERIKSWIWMKKSIFDYTLQFRILARLRPVI